MKWRLLVCLIAWALASRSHAASCPVTVGTLTLNAVVTRSSGISPLLVFFDATGTTDSAISGNFTVFQNVYFSWTFGDSGASGTGTWANGSNPGGNSQNSATGAIAAHLYRTNGTTTTYNATVTAFDGTNTASCTLSATAYDPSDATNGLPGTKTICQSSSGTPVAGSGGCPAGAAVSNSASEGTNISASMATKRVLFKCGDTFSGGANFGGTTFSIGAYGGCQDTQTNRPIFHGALTAGTGTVKDGRIADIDFESTGSYAFTMGYPSAGNQNGPVTFYNLLSHGNNTSYYYAQCQQCGMIQDVMNGMGSAQGVYLNYAQNNCSNLVSGYPCTAGFQNINYMAVLGNLFDGAGAGGGSSGVETVRISACRLCAIENNTIQNANTVGAVLKLHNGNTFNTACIWTGQWTELIEESDNLFTGQSGAQLVENTAQNAVTDERLRNIVIERNLFKQTAGTNEAMALSAMNASFRDNVCNMSADAGTHCAHVGNRGVQGSSNNTTGSTCSGSGTTSAPTIPLYPQYVQVLNDTCYQNSTSCVAFAGGGDLTAPGNNSVAQNVLVYTTNGGSVSSNTGTGNTISNNTVAVTLNPAFTNGTGVFSKITDFKPTANVSGATSVTNYYDAVLTAWLPAWNLGAIKLSGTPVPPGPRHRLLLSRLGVPIELQP